MPVDFIETISPFSEAPLAEYRLFDALQIDNAVFRAALAFEEWRSLSLTERSKSFEALAVELERHRELLAQTAVAEMGKPIVEARAEINKCIFTARWYAGNAQEYLEPLHRKAGTLRAEIHFRPLGTVLGIMPWNFPFWQVFRFAIPTMLAGNTVLLKHAPNVTGCALLIGQLFEKAGFPVGAFSVLVADHSMTLRALQNPAVHALSFTGSTNTGRILAQHCGRLLKPSVLELGGSDAFIVLDDADLDLAATKAVASRFINSGQSCIAAKRILVQEKVYDAFRDRFLAGVKNLTIGDPANESSNIGPLARKDLKESLAAQVSRSVQNKSEILFKSEIPSNGFFHPVTILEPARRDVPVCTEETFGPVVPLILIENEKQAVLLANQTGYTLGAAVFTANRQRFRTIAGDLKAGSCFMNELVYSDARLPFGGNGPSGWGRELAEFGARAFCNVQTVAFPSQEA